MTEKLFEAFDFIFVFAVTNHQVVVFFSNDQVIDALNDDIFSGRNVHNTSFNLYMIIEIKVRTFPSSDFYFNST